MLSPVTMCSSFHTYSCLAKKAEIYGLRQKKCPKSMVVLVMPTHQGLLLSNFLDALALASIIPKRVMLQTGIKNYGAHLGPMSVPCVEDDPRHDLEPNFYYTQEDYLWKWCKDNNSAWNVARPS